MSHPSSTGRGPEGLGRHLSRTTRLVLIGGLAAGAGFASVTSIASASTGSSHTSTSTSSAGGASPSPGQPPPPPTGPRRGRPFWPGRGPGPFGGPGGMGRPGGGTITRIEGSTLVLRTMNGTETVDTSSSTVFAKELQTITLSRLQVGDVVRVATTPPSTGSPAPSPSPSSPPPPGTGTVDATRVTVVEPSFTGRVTAVGDGSYTLVGPDGQLLTVSTTGSTRYYKGRSPTTSSAVSDGTRVIAVGPQTSLTHLDADLITVAPAPPAPGRAPSPPSPAGAPATRSGR